MTIRQYLELDSLAFFFLVAAAVIAYATFSNHQPFQSRKIFLPVVTNLQTPTTPLLTTPKPQIFSQTSPDGTKQLTLTVTTNQNLSRTYSFATSDIDGSNHQTIYTITYTKDSMSMPFNTWSPDDNFVFVIHHSDTGDEALVMKANGQPLTADEQTQNVTQLFNARNFADTYNETTGWASETLLIITTKNTNGENGTSYWFEVPTKAIIPLATQF